MDAIHGITMQKLAEIWNKEGELKAKHGQREAEAHFHAHLASLGTDINTFSHAHNAWLERWKADRTGMLEAKYHQYVAELSQKTHFGDVRDMSADLQGGITLDTYAQLTVKMSQPGADAEAIARAHGLPNAAAWIAANTLWAGAMAADTSFKLTTQFGQLYQKYAGPAFADAQLAATAQILADSHKPKDDVVDEPEADLSQGTLLKNLKSPSRKTRWEAARWLAHQYDADDEKKQVNLECVPVLHEVLERHDEHTVSNAEDAARKLIECQRFDDETRSVMTRCLNRAREKLGTLQAAFAPIQDQAVPERVFLQSQIQDYTSLVESLEGHLANDFPS